MKNAKFLFALSLFAAAGYVRAADSSAEVVELPTVVVEATRLADPLAEMRASLLSRAQVKPPGRLNVQLPLFRSVAKTGDATARDRAYSFKSVRHARPVL